MSEQQKPVTVREAGRRGGEATALRHGPDFYAEIGRKGGAKVRELIAAGRAAQFREAFERGGLPREEE